MQNERPGAAGIRAVAGEADIEVDGWCATGLDRVMVARNLREELQITKPDPEDLVDDYDLIAVWCDQTGEVTGSRWRRTRQPRRSLRQLAAAADAWLAEGGLDNAPGSPDGQPSRER